MYKCLHTSVYIYIVKSSQACMPGWAAPWGHRRWKNRHKQTARYGVSLKAIPLPPGSLALQNTKQANYTAWKNE